MPRLPRRIEVGLDGIGQFGNWLQRMSHVLAVTYDMPLLQRRIWPNLEPRCHQRCSNSLHRASLSTREPLLVR